MLLEVVISTFLAPIRMLLHSSFVINALIGRGAGWNAQNRDDSGTAWSDAVRFHWWGTVLGVIWGGLMYLISPSFFLWLSPIVVGLTLSIPISVWTSRISLGEGARKLGLFLTPVDTMPGKELLDFEENLVIESDYSVFPLAENDGFKRAVIIPSVYSLHLSLVHNRRKLSTRKIEMINKIINKAVEKGPQALSPKEKLAVLNESFALTELHKRVWALPHPEASVWGFK